MFLTQYIDIDYDAEALCPTFQKFMSDIFNGNQEMISFMKRALGYSLTGHTKEQCLFVAHGTGSNGKSTLLEIVEDVLRDYASTSPMSTLMKEKFKSGIPNDIARLRGARMVKASEGEKEQSFSEALIKQLTGGDKMTARFLHKEFFTFTPLCKLWIVTNWSTPNV
jgi:putative DNA primase/helicase